MRIDIQSPHIDLPTKIEKSMIRKFERFTKYSDRILACNLVLKKEKSATQNGYIVEARLSVPGNDFFAKENASSFEVAAEKVCIDLENKFRKQRENRNLKEIPPADNFIIDEEMQERSFE